MVRGKWESEQGRSRYAKTYNKKQKHDEGNQPINNGISPLERRTFSFRAKGFTRRNKPRLSYPPPRFLLIFLSPPKPGQSKNNQRERRPENRSPQWSPNADIERRLAWIGRVNVTRTSLPRSQ
jgi:hypothetical protein